MQTHRILLAVDADEASMRAVEYVADVVRQSGGKDAGAFFVLVVHVERLPGRDLYENEQDWRKDCEQAREKVQVFLEKAREALKEKGVPRQAVEVKYFAACDSPFEGDLAICSRDLSVGEEILRAAEAEKCRTVAVGRRGVEKAEEFLFGSVSSKVIHAAGERTVWVVA